MNQQEIEKRNRILISWYRQNCIKFTLIKYLYNRELALLMPNIEGLPEEQKDVVVRNFRCHNVKSVEFLLYDLLNLETDKKIMNVYYSLSEYKNGLPKFTANLTKRQTESEFIDWKENYYKQVIGFDCVIDVDPKSHSETKSAHETTIRIHKLFNELKVPHQIRFSGKGFHVVIPYEFFSELKLNFDPHAEENIYKFYTQITKKLFEEVSEMVDWKIMDSRRILKIPFSLANYESGVYVCFPFVSEPNFLDFKLEDYNYENFSMRDYKFLIPLFDTHHTFNKKFLEEKNTEGILEWLHLKKILIV